MTSRLRDRVFAATTIWALAGVFPILAQSPATPESKGNDRPREEVVLPEPIPDPLEPFNRAMWALNKGVMTGVIKPSAKVYRVIVPPPLRRGVRNFGRNITYPGRLINNLLQAKWTGARDESYRFGCNTVLGLGGFFDVASRFDVPKADADFGQTFGQWGWKPQCFVMLPLFGPSNERDTVGLAADTAANPLTYWSPYRFVASRPWTYLGPYSYASYAVTYNNLSDQVEDYVRFSRTEKDPYSELAYAWTFVREGRVLNVSMDAPRDEASLETLRTVFFTFKDKEFPERGRVRSVLIPTTGKRLQYSVWLQPKRAPVVYIVPGLGSHRLASAALALAELAFQNGFSSVCISSPFNYEFMENAATADLPGYTPIDAADMRLALTEIDHQLEHVAPGRIGARALLGYSMGGFQSLFVAGGATGEGMPMIQFDRIIAINTPVRLLYGTDKLDQFFDAPLAWPAPTRQQQIENTFYKVAALTGNSITPQAGLPFSAVESKFLIGVAFRLILRDVIYSTQQRSNLGILRNSLNPWRREPVYREILQYGYQDYFDRFAIPYYQQHGLDMQKPMNLAMAGDLRTYEAGLKANRAIRVFVNRNDFLLADSDLAWLQSTFGSERLTVFERGGHLGNLFRPDVQQAILESLEDLKSK